MDKVKLRVLRVALQKSGKLSEGSFALLNKCSYQIRPTRSHYLLHSEKMNTEFLMLRDDDIPGFVDSKASDLGIVGENGYIEYSLANPQHDLEIIARLKFSQCRLSIAVAGESQIRTLADLQGKTIATSYPATLKDFLQRSGLSAKIIVMHGSVELAPKIAIADAICDLVSSGATLREHGLVELEVLLYSEAVLIGQKSASPAILERRKELLFRLQSVINAENRKYIMLHIAKAQLKQLNELLPASLAPTIMPLHGTEEKLAVHILTKEDTLWETIDKLKALGASSILVLPIEKMME